MVGHSVRSNMVFRYRRNARAGRRFSRIGLRTGSHPLAPVGGSTQAGYRSWINHTVGLGIMIDFAEDVFETRLNETLMVHEALLSDDADG